MATKTPAKQKTQPKRKASPKPKRITRKAAPEEVAIGDLKPHPKNYREHTDDQLAHIEESIRANGVYRNVVIAKDGTILAGHGVVQAAMKMGMKTITVIRLPFASNDPRALKVLAGDNEISRLARVDDRELTNLLKEIADSPDYDLVGTGFDDRMLAALVMVTRPQDEIGDFDAAAEWVGMPDHEPGTPAYRLLIQFRNADDRVAFLKHAKLADEKLAAYTGGKVWSTWWPEKEGNDLDSLKFEPESKANGKAKTKPTA